MPSRAAGTDYLIDVWDTEHNLPSSTVTAIAQTPDGYLWLGTYSGLARFDGVRFMLYDPDNTPALRYPRIQGLYVDCNGTLWINTYRGGLTSYRDGSFQAEWKDQSIFDLHTSLVSSTSNKVLFATQFGEILRRTTGPGTNVNWTVIRPPTGWRPSFQCVGGDGVVWFVTRDRDARVVRMINDEFQELPNDSGLAGKRVVTLVTDKTGRVWAGAADEIALWDGTRFQTMTPTNGEPTVEPVLLFPTSKGELWVLAGDRLRKQVGRRWVAEAAEWRGLLGWAAGRGMVAHEDRLGGMWFTHYGNGLFHVTPDGHFQRLTTREGLPGDRINTFFEARDGGMWLGVDRGGLARLRERRFQVIGQMDGLGARAALSVCGDTNGVAWIGTAGGGLCRWYQGKITRYSVGGSASANHVFSIYPRADGGIWLSAGEGEDLYFFKDGQIQKASWDVHGVKSILEDRAGRVWTGTKSGLAWWSAQGRRVFGANDGLGSSAVRAIALGPDGIVWCGADDGTLYRCEPDALQAYRPKDSLADQPIWSLLADDAGVIWAGTFRGGLLRFKNGKFTRFSAKQGLSVDVIGQIVEDDQGRLWLGTHQGICRVSKSMLDECSEGKKSTIDGMFYATYGRLDGLPTLECSDGYQPACWRDNEGRLWFTTVRGVVSVNPRELTASSFAPPVVIEEFRVDRESLPIGSDKLVVPPGHRQFVFRFTALGFDAPDKTRFRHRLDGFDPEGADWVDADTRRTANYGHLPAGQYRFRVVACNNDGVWSETEAFVDFRVKPYIYQTWWFLTLTGTAILVAVILAVRKSAARKFERELAHLEQQHAIERDRARIAKDIHDDIGAGLTQITLLSELARREPEQASAHLDRISGSARQLTRAMDEIVWAVDPQHDTFSGLMDYVSAYAEDFLRTAGIRCRMDLPTTLPAMRVEAELRYHLFLALKEALNNIVKHAHATEVWLRLQVAPNAFCLVVEDNGRGLPVGKLEIASPEQPSGSPVRGARIASGSGLSNLEQRLAALGGRCVVQSTPGHGTRVEMTLSIQREQNAVAPTAHEAVA